MGPLVPDPEVGGTQTLASPSAPPTAPCHGDQQPCGPPVCSPAECQRGGAGTAPSLPSSCTPTRLCSVDCW
ncbi:hypothetical protein DV515_00019474 [Chloebia gouldiae]|uniref:Uncharacterized protein n=1 Tax=Chloebia gouldiae TaxID=44316 RepID=A0A3L8Q555_CHLGU|nr:hypothetical protein DV515_00019474 [Chloebia gouldiae]